MEPAEKKLYLEIKKGEESDIKTNGFGVFISEMKKVDQNEKARIEGNRLFYENRENEILSFHKKIVEAKTLNELTEVRKLIKNRISALNHKACEKFPDLNNTLSRLKDLLQIADEEIKEGTIEQLQQEPETPAPWHHPIFKTPESLQLFEKFIAEENDHYPTDCSFIYRMMHDREKPTLIHEHIKPGMFTKWHNDTYKENEPLPDGLKTWVTMGTKNRKKTYSRLKKELRKNDNLKVY